MEGIAESNCVAQRRGGEQLEAKEQSARNEHDSAEMNWRAGERMCEAQNSALAIQARSDDRVSESLSCCCHVTREAMAGVHPVVGGGMFGRSSGLSTDTRRRSKAARSQSRHSSCEARESGGSKGRQEEEKQERKDDGRTTCGSPGTG